MSWYQDLMSKGKPKSKIRSGDKVKKELNKTIKEVLKRVNYQTSENLFYDLMFGDSYKNTADMSTVELDVVNRIESKLIDPSSIEFEPFPQALREVLEKIDKNRSITDIEASLQQDPVLSVNIVRFANSAAFRFSGMPPVTSLRMAITRVGLESLKLLVTTASMSNFMQVSPIYFKMYGEKIWQHSFITAQICEKKAIESKEDPFNAFFVGIIHQIGKIAIFNEILAAIKVAHDVEIGSKEFRRSVEHLSKQLTYNIVRQWQLPNEIIEPIKTQMIYGRVQEPCTLSTILIESVYLSELNLLFKNKMITREDVSSLLAKNSISDSNEKYIYEMSEVCGVE